MAKNEAVTTAQDGEKFIQSIRSFASQRIETINKNIERTVKAEIDKQEKLIQAEMHSNIERGVSKAKSEVTRMYASKEQEEKKALLLRRQEILDAVFSSARLKLQEFTKTEEYQTFLKQCASKLSHMFTHPDTKFFVKEADLVYASLITSAYGKTCTVEKDNRLQIGGLLAESESLGLVEDLSLDSMLEAQQPWFEKNSGLEVM